MNRTNSYMPQSKSDTHITPDRVYELIENNWGYKKNEMFDPCPVNFTQSGLNIDWKEVNFVNPPYTLLKEFVAKAVFESFRNTTIMLLPVKTDQKWFHDLKHWWKDIVWIRGRLKFKNNKWSATQPHFLVYIH